MRDIDRCYQILELEPGASSDEVKRAYRDLVKVWHPDRFPGDSQLQQKAQDKLKEINDAYERLQSIRPNPRPRPRRADARLHHPGTRPRHDNGRSRGPEARRCGLGGWILLVMACALIWEVLLSPFGGILRAHRGYFTIGSTKDQVLAVQGTPTRLIISTPNSTWYYGLSKVHFSQGRVVSWDVSPQNPLKVQETAEP